MKLEITFGPDVWPENCETEMQAAVIAQKIFELVTSAKDAGQGARALDFALRGLSNLEAFTELLEESGRITDRGIELGMIRFRVIPVRLV